MIQNLCNSKRMYHRKSDYLESKVAYTLASFNILALWNGLSDGENLIYRISIADFHCKLIVT
ncbi:MAG: hypothetical protein H7263_14380 [Candidatus Sericytochromatia bacterium]|nr:hypothetical protein [Candidatus Sericytochromatia bacterium]